MANVVYHHRTRGRGAEGVHIMGIVDALRELGHKVTLLSFPGADPEQPETPVVQADRTSAKSDSLFVRLAKLTKHVPQWVFEFFEIGYNLIAWWRLRKLMVEEKPTFIYERYSLFMIAGVWLAKKRQIPIVLEVNDSALVERVRPLFFKSLARSMEKYVFKRASGLVFISSYFRDLAREHYGSIVKDVICPNGADITVFDPSSCDRTAIRKRYNMDDKIVCGYVGAFVYWHGIDWFVEEIAPQLKEYPHLVLLLVGDGVVYEDIVQLIQQYDLREQIILTGRVPHDQVKHYVAAMDYGILPDSNLYGSPMKLFEMMAMGVALVSPAFMPLQEVVEDAKTGWLFPPKDKKAAVEKVLQLSTCADELRQVGAAARDYIIAHRQWKNNAATILNLVD